MHIHVNKQIYIQRNHPTLQEIKILYNKSSRQEDQKQRAE